MIKETKYAYHFYIGDQNYIGMLTFSGELSDFRANIIQRHLFIKAGEQEEKERALKKILETLLECYVEEQTFYSIPDTALYKKKVMDNHQNLVIVKEKNDQEIATMNHQSFNGH
ncbi:MAG: hypothetical protein GTO02_08665 [Candidatus Dadabacteria bacterium]|nr:hypothetical protein [Candidatus Dadabacteria bacterium]